MLIDKSIIKRSVKGDFDTHKNKITLTGVVFYCLTAVSAIVGLIVLFAVPKVPIESFDMGKYAFYGNTANEHFVACLIGTLLFTGIALYFLNIINVDTSCRSARRMSKITNVVLLILCVLLVIISFAGMITNIDLLIFG